MINYAKVNIICFSELLTILTHIKKDGKCFQFNSVELDVRPLFIGILNNVRGISRG